MNDPSYRDPRLWEDCETEHERRQYLLNGGRVLPWARCANIRDGSYKPQSAKRAPLPSGEKARRRVQEKRARKARRKNR